LWALDTTKKTWIREQDRDKTDASFCGALPSICLIQILYYPAMSRCSVWSCRPGPYIPVEPFQVFLVPFVSNLFLNLLCFQNLQRCSMHSNSFLDLFNFVPKRRITVYACSSYMIQLLQNLIKQRVAKRNVKSLQSFQDHTTYLNNGERSTKAHF
jgi:hypothetical protein